MRFPKGVFKLLFMILIVSMTACSNGVEANKYGAYLDDTKNGFLQEVHEDGIVWSATYQPVDYIAIRQLQGKSLEQVRQDYLGMQYFTFEISDTEGGGIKSKIAKKLGNEAYEKAMAYYRFDMQPDLKLIAGQDTMPCTMYHLEQTGHMTTKMRMMLGFKDDKKMEAKTMPCDLKLILNDQVLHSDTLIFTFQQQNLNKILPIKI